MTQTDNNNLLIDAGAAAAGLTLPYWAELLGAWIGLTVSIATLVLIIFRIILAVREWKRG